jgi:hypothetical protein
MSVEMGLVWPLVGLGLGSWMVVDDPVLFTLMYIQKPFKLLKLKQRLCVLNKNICNI